MQVLNFYSTVFADQMKRGRKTATIRLGDKTYKYKKNQLVLVTVGYQYSPREKLFHAVIDNVEVKRVKDLSPRDIEHDNPEFRRTEELIHFLEQIYGKTVSLEDTVTVVRFSQIIENPPDFQDRLRGVGGAQNYASSGRPAGCTACRTRSTAAGRRGAGCSPRGSDRPAAGQLRGVDRRRRRGHDAGHAEGDPGALAALDEADGVGRVDELDDDDAEHRERHEPQDLAAGHLDRGCERADGADDGEGEESDQDPVGAGERVPATCAVGRRDLATEAQEGRLDRGRASRRCAPLRRARPEPRRTRAVRARPADRTPRRG